MIKVIIVIKMNNYNNYNYNNSYGKVSHKYEHIKTNFAVQQVNPYLYIYLSVCILVCI